MLSVAYFGYLAERNSSRFPDLARAMGEKVDGLPRRRQALAFVKGLKKLIRKVGLEEHKFSDFGIRRDDLERLAENSFHTMGKLFALTPIRLTVRDATAIYERAYA